MIGQTISHYRILAQIGEGGMGVVYVAEDTLLGRRVAVKFPLGGADEKNYHARFQREARAVSSITHKNIAAVYDFGETERGQPYIVMELVTGQTLGEILTGAGLSLARAVEIIEDVAEALAAAHRRGVVHRDIKPSNVIINEQGEVKVLDFGLAKQFDEERNLVSSPEAQTLLTMRTRSDVIIGTPLYLSPEQARGAKVDGRSDLFTLGALLYECVAGRPAFSGANVIEIGAQVLHVDPPPPSKLNPRVPAELDRVCLKALSKKPEERYQTAEEMIVDLERARARLPASDTLRTRRLTTQPHVTRSSALMTLSEGLRRPRLSPLAFLAGLVVVLLGIWGVAYLRKPAAHVPPREALEAYTRGLEAMRAGAYYRASTELEQAVKLDNKFALAHASLAEAWGELDYLDRQKDELLAVEDTARESLSQLDALYLSAVTATARRDFAEAVKAYEEIARLQPDSPKARLDLGRAYEKNSETDKAIESYMRVTELDPRYAAAFLRLGVLYGRKRNTAGALETFARAEKLYEEQGNTEGRAEVFYQRGFHYRNAGAGKIPEARAQLEQALSLAESVGNQSQRISALLQLSAVFYAENNSARAEAAAREALETARAHGMETLTARGLADLGNVFFARSNYVEADKYLQQSLEYARRNKARRAEAFALINLGSLRLQQSRPDEAVDHVNQALNFYRQANFPKEVSLGLLIIGRANQMKGDYDGALRSFEEQLRLAEQSGDTSQAGIAHEGIGTVLAIQERYTEALQHYTQKHAISKSLGDQKGVGYGLLERANMLWQLGKYDEARELLDQATALADRPDGGSKELLAQVLVTRAEMALSESQFSEAQAQAERALAVANTQYPDAVIGAKRVLGLAQVLSGAGRGGLRSCEEAAELAKSLNNFYLISKTMLALALARLENSDASGALAAALEAQERFARHGQLASEWQALMIASRASRKLGDVAKASEQSARAADIMARMQQQWGAEAFKIYLDRPDVRYYYPERVTSQ
jgi:serine/threonine-protein kinase